MSNSRNFGNKLRTRISGPLSSAFFVLYLLFDSPQKLRCLDKLGTSKAHCVPLAFTDEEAVYWIFNLFRFEEAE